MKMQSPSKMRILVADPNEIVQQMYNEMLKPISQVEWVGTASSGREALLLTGSREPDLVLMSPQLRADDSVQTVKNICQIFPKTQVLVIAIQKQDEGVAEMLQAGAKDVLLKETPVEKVIKRLFWLHRQGNRE